MTLEGIPAPSKKSIEVAAQCWCDPRTENIGMIPELATVFAEKIEEYRQALIWCTGASDFAPDGVARVGWEKGVQPLL